MKTQIQTHVVWKRARTLLVQGLGFVRQPCRGCGLLTKGGPLTDPPSLGSPSIGVQSFFLIYSQDILVKWKCLGLGWGVEKVSTWTGAANKSLLLKINHHDNSALRNLPFAGLQAKGFVCCSDSSNPNDHLVRQVLVCPSYTWGNRSRKVTFLSQCQTAGVEQHWGGLKHFGAPGPEQEDPRGSCMQQKGQIQEGDGGEMMGQPHLSISGTTWLHVWLKVVLLCPH